MTRNTAIAAGGAELLASWTRAAELVHEFDEAGAAVVSRKSDSATGWRFVKPTAIRSRACATSRSSSPLERTPR
jgi:hypothetical protein